MFRASFAYLGKPKIMPNLFGCCVLYGLLLSVSAAAEPPLPTSFQWRTGPALLQAQPVAGVDWIAVKDPTIVYASDRWHLFCTVRGQQRSHAILYWSASQLNALQSATPHLLTCHAGFFCAPQVFYYSPHQKWYLICQAADTSWTPNYQAAYSTTADITKPDSWSPLQPLGLRQADGKSGLDFWIICDDQQAHLFFTTLDGRLWRAATARADFPTEWSEPTVALQADIFEASHTYRLNGSPHYLTLVEAQHGHGWRYFKAYWADRLEGPWQPWAASKDHAFASMKNVIQEPKHWTDSISHGELLRLHADETLTVDPKQLRFLFQGVSDQDHKRSSKYGDIPWKLGLLEPVPIPIENN